MAHVVTSTLNIAHAVEHAFVNGVKSITGLFDKVGEAHSRSAEYERLSNLTDVELATRYGIQRSQIAEYIFSDRAYYTM